MHASTYLQVHKKRVGNDVSLSVGISGWMTGCKGAWLRGLQTRDQPFFSEALKTAENIPRCVASNDDRGRASNRSRSRGRGGQSRAARVSRGSEFDVWKGLSVKAPKRHDSEHVTITVVVYNVVRGGVPSTADVVNAIDDLEMLYKACSDDGHLEDSTFDFMKDELKVKDMLDISCKMQSQPPAQDVERHDVFPVA